MTSSEEEKKDNREVAKNESKRQTIGDIRVSAWTLAFSFIAAVIVVAIVWIWLNH